MNINYIEAWNMLNSMDNILLITHSNPDGDAVGSIFALYGILKKLGKNVRCEIKDIPAVMQMLVREDAFCDFREDFVVSVDLADPQLMMNDIKARYSDKVDLSIDHHETNVTYAKNTLLKADAAAACEVIFNMVSEAGFEIDTEIARCLYVGLATDTGCFRYANTTASTLRVAASLIEKGVESAKINTDIFETKSRAYVMFETMAMNSLRTYLDGKCAVLLITKDMYTKANITESESQGINALPRQIEGVLAGVTVKERTNGTYKISIRSREPLNASEICALMGGGGHRLAAGCELSGTAQSVINTVVKFVKQAIEEL
ncbi:MAG: bifunctional oligoribonuclease/PAP phosphatase NrnA [Clostridia bacterium]|nr:bifunctional oligoribonuclease/PAP phosphatase NrnA [Clostridia bacterium]